MAGLTAHALTCVKRDRVLFADLSFTLPAGSLTYLRGPNGAGKTSLLRLLTGLSLPDQGEILFNDVPIAECLPQFHASLTYIGHKPGLNSALSAIENLQYWCAQHSIGFSLETAYKVLTTLGLVGLEDIPVRMLSAGQQRRVALGRLWLKSADIWILDEPFTALDISGIKLLEAHMKSHVEQGGTVITTSHQALSEVAGPVTLLDLEYRI